MGYTQYPIKCLECGLHFTVHTEYPESHTLDTLYCPECGQHNGHFLMFKAEVEGFIFQYVPGAAEFHDALLPK